MGIVISDIEEALERARCWEGDLYLYGTGFCAKSVYYFLKAGVRANKGQIKGFIQTRRTQEQVLGLAVLSVWEFARLAPENTCVIIAVQDKYQKEIAELLRRFHICEYCGLRWNGLAAGIRAMKEADRDRLWKCFPWYSNLQDAESKLVFTNAMLAKMSCDLRYYLDMQAQRETFIQSESGGRTIADWVREGRHLEEKKNFLYAPNKSTLEYFGPRFSEMGILAQGVCTDQDLFAGTIWRGLLVWNLEQLAALCADGNILMACGQKSVSYATLNKMRTLGFEEKNLLLPCSMDNPFAYGMQYFDLPAMRPEKDEVFIDAGCFDCGTVQTFVELTNGRYRHIYSFEPDAASFRRCQGIRKDKQFRNHTLLNKGLWSSQTVLHFHSEGTALSKVSETAENVVETVTLDQVLKNEKVTWIKMDIEGAELEALKGSERIIREQKPKLAISIYHKAEDFVDIPAWLLALAPEYKLYYRHYSLYKYETILYAMV